MRRTVTAVALIGVALVAAGCKNESGERGAGCDDKQSVVTAKKGRNESGHLMMYVSCDPTDPLATWYVTWDNPTKDQDDYDAYAVGDPYP